MSLALLSTLILQNSLTNDTGIFFAHAFLVHFILFTQDVPIVSAEVFLTFTFNLITSSNQIRSRPYP